MEPTRELFEISRTPDPAGTGLVGTDHAIRLDHTAIGHPVLFYQPRNHRPLVLVADVYHPSDRPLYIHLLCPMCVVKGRQNALLIRSEARVIRYDPLTPPPVPPDWSPRQLAETFPEGLGGSLSVAAFRCSWEEDPSLRRVVDSVCPWHVAIDNNVVRDL